MVATTPRLRKIMDAMHRDGTFLKIYPDVKTMPTAIAYCRVSTSKQDLSLSQQQAACAAWCAANGYTLADTLIDADVSGSVPLLQRTAGSHLPAMVRSHRASVVVSTYVDRLFRDALDGLQCMRTTFNNLNLRVVLVNEALDLTTATGRLQATIRLATAEYERELIADRTRRTSQRLQNDGRVYGHVPFGCVAVDGKLFRLFEQWASRQYIVEQLQLHPLRTVQASLRSKRVLSPQGVRGWSLNTLGNLLRTHERLSSLPWLEVDCAAGQGRALDAGVSP